MHQRSGNIDVVSMLREDWQHQGEVATLKEEQQC